jgi:hypothetical protein
MSQLTIVPCLQLAPFAQIMGRSRLDEVAHEDPCAVDGQDEGTIERSQVVHHRDVDWDIRSGRAISDQQGRPRSVIESMDDRVIASEA